MDNDPTTTVNLNGFFADRVMAVRCDKCNNRIDTSQMEPLERISCPGCGHPIYVPVRVGDYLLLRRLGRGGQGSVYGGWDIGLHRTVALKVMVPKEGEAAPDWSSLEAEAQAAANLNHPHVAQVYNFGYHNGQPYLVMELVRGRSFDEFRDADGSVNIRFVFEVAKEIAEGLAQAAEINLLHSDIKPENIMIAPASGAKLVDFGLAGIAGSGAGAGGGDLWGSPYYIAPERVQGKPATIRSDMYSLGVTIYHALAGVPPFGGSKDDTIESIMRSHVTQKAPPLRAKRANIPPEAEALVARMMAKEPGRRHPTYKSLISDIQRVIDVTGGEFDISDFAARRFASKSSVGGKLKTMTLPLLRLTGSLRSGNKMPVPRKNGAGRANVPDRGEGEGGQRQAGASQQRILKVGGAAQEQPAASGRVSIRKKSPAPQKTQEEILRERRERSLAGAGGRSRAASGGGVPGALVAVVVIAIIVVIVILVALGAAMGKSGKRAEISPRNGLYSIESISV